MEITKNQQQQILWIDLAKGICILLVVFHHIIQSTYNLPSIDLRGIDAIFHNIYEILSVKLVPLRMPLFFMISGFLVYKGVLTYPWSKVWYPRIQNIWYVYLVWSLLQWLLMTIILLFWDISLPTDYVLISNQASDLPTFTKLFLFGTSSLWYLYALPIYFLICKTLHSKPVACVSLFLLANLLSEYYELQFPTSSIVKNGVFYALGCFLCPWLLPKVSKLKGFKNTVLAIFALLFFKLFLSFLNIDINLINTILIVGIMVLFLNWFQANWDIPLLRWVGKNTLQIYVIHYIFVRLLALVFIPYLISSGKFANSEWVTAWYTIYPVFALILVTICSLLIWKITSFGLGKYLYKAPSLNRPK